MMYKLLIFLLYSTLIFSKDIIVEGNPVEKEFVKKYLTENFQITNGNFITESPSKDNILTTLVILNDNLKTHSGNFQRIRMNEKEYEISDVQVKEYSNVPNIYAEFYSPWKKIPYIWEDDGKIYINGFDFMKEPSVKIIFKDFLLTHFKKEITEKQYTPPPKIQGANIKKTTTNLSLLFSFGGLILVLFLFRTRKKGYGNPFKGE